MSETTFPVSAVSDLQRPAVEQTHEALIRGVEAHEEFGEAFVGFGRAPAVNERSYDAIHAVVDG